jgi:glycosyltransferase involved in cell wall biosynthesis
LRISVVVNNYNYARFLDDAIGSALDQDHQDLEVLVVDDGSTDHSLAVARRYEPKVRVITQPNGGQCAAFNTGIRSATGEGVIFLDADDRLAPGAVAFHAEQLAGDAVVRSMGRMRVIDADGSPDGSLVPGRTPTPELARGRTLQAGPGAYICPPTSGNAWRGSFLQQIAPLPEPPEPTAADGFLMDTAPLYGQVTWTPQLVADYRVHNQSLQSGLRGAITDAGLQRVLRQHEQRCRFLARHCERLNLPVQPATWTDNNWRVRLARRLQARDAPAGSAGQLLAAAWRAGPSGTRRAVLLTMLLTLALCPAGIDRRLASRVLSLAYM